MTHKHRERVHLEIRVDEAPNFTRVPLSKINPTVKKQIEEITRDHPEWGWRRIQAHLRVIVGLEVSTDVICSIFYPQD